MDEEDKPAPRWVEEWVYHEAKEWVNIALLCEKLHTLPLSGGLLDQDEKTVGRLLVIYNHLDDYREIQMKTPTTENSEAPRGSNS